MNDKLNEILINWDIPLNLPVREIDESDGVRYLGHIWFIGDSYVLKRYENEDRNNQLINNRILTALEKQGFAVAPLHTRGGEEIVNFDETNSFYILTRYVPGKTLTDDEIRSDKMPEYSYKIGQALAKLHIAFISVEESVTTKNANTYKSVTEWAIPKVKKANDEFQMGLDESFFIDYIETFGGLYTGLPKQLIHRDSHPLNIVFKDGEVSGFIDFVIGERDTRLRDVCYCLTGLGNEFYDSPEKWLDIIKQMLDGYNSVSPLTEEEKQSVFYIMCSIQFTCVAYFANNEQFKQAWEENRRLTPFVVKHKNRIIEICKAVKTR